MFVDARNALVGRLSAFVAKQLLLGESINVINAEQAMISGEPAKIVEKYAGRRQMRSFARPEKSPSQSWSRRPDFLLRRIIRGMLPKDSRRGKEALRRLRVWLGIPKELEEKLKTSPPVIIPKPASELRCKWISLRELCEALGWRGLQA